MKIRHSLYMFVGAATLIGLTACQDVIESGDMANLSAYEQIYKNNVSVSDLKTGKMNPMVELYEASKQVTLQVELAKAATTSTSAKAVVDANYLETYNKMHNTQFELFPAELVQWDSEGKVMFANGAKQGTASFMLNTSDALEADKTYALPISLTETSSDLSMDTDRHCVYLIKDMHSAGNAFKGDDAIKAFLYFEVNDTNPLNALSFQLENGKYLWDAVCLFAANINWDSEAGRPYVKCNPNVQYLLDNNEKFLQPLRKRGIKVILGLLGNHDMTGLAQLSEQGAKDFAREVAHYCYAYNLDGVNYDDEYSNGPDTSNPALARRSQEAAARLCYETKRVMPDKIVSVYDYGLMYGEPTVDGVDISEWMDIVVPDYGIEAHPIGKLTYANCAGAALEFAIGRGGNLSRYVSNLKEYNYGWFMGFAPDPSRYTAVFRRLSAVSDLYGVGLKQPTVFYKKNDPKPYRYPADLNK